MKPKYPHLKDAILPNRDVRAIRRLSPKERDEHLKHLNALIGAVKKRFATKKRGKP